MAKYLKRSGLVAREWHHLWRFAYFICQYVSLEKMLPANSQNAILPRWSSSNLKRQRV